jgi:hypothetical protein
MLQSFWPWRLHCMSSGVPWSLCPSYLSICISSSSIPERLWLQRSDILNPSTPQCFSPCSFPYLPDSLTSCCMSPSLNAQFKIIDAHHCCSMSPSLLCFPLSYLPPSYIYLLSSYVYITNLFHCLFLHQNVTSTRPGIFALFYSLLNLLCLEKSLEMAGTCYLSCNKMKFPLPL